jgi:tetratricopeptide (TPR) repeat protein
VSEFVHLIHAPHDMCMFHTGAVSDFSAAIEVEPRYADSWKRRGQARSALGQLQEALADLQRAIDLLPHMQGVVRVLCVRCWWCWWKVWAAYNGSYKTQKLLGGCRCRAVTGAQTACCVTLGYVGWEMCWARWLWMCSVPDNDT